MTLRLIRLTEVKRKTGIGRTKIYEMIKSGDFPPSCHIGVRAVAWLESEVDEWIESKTALSPKKKSVS